MEVTGKHYKNNVTQSPTQKSPKYLKAVINPNSKPADRKLLKAPPVYTKIIESHLPELNIVGGKSSMRFGNYTYKEYGLIAPRMDPELSLFEKLYLKNHINKEALTKNIDLLNSQEGKSIILEPSVSYTKTSGPKTTRPNLSYYLFSKKTPYSKMIQRSSSDFVNSGMVFSSKSQKERFKKIAMEFEILKNKIIESPNDAKIFAMAVWCFII